MAKPLTLTISANDAPVVRDALTDAAIALRTDRRTEVVRNENEWLNDPEVSQVRKDRYLILIELAHDAADYIRLSRS